MRLPIDTDAFCKLGVAQLLNDAVSHLGVALESCERLPALPRMLRRGKLRKWLGDALSDELLPLAERLPQVTGVDETWLGRLVGISNIDPGEAQLFAAVASGNVLMLSGDKRALKAVSALPELVEALAGRVVAVEAIFIVLCQSLGVERVRQSVSRLMPLDTAIRVCFSNSDPMAGLRSYYRSLVEDVAPLVLWAPPRGEGP